MTRHAGAAAHLQETTNGSLDSVYPGIVSWGAHRACDVRSNANARPAIGEQGCFSSCRASRGVRALVWVGGSAEDVVGGFEGEECDGNIGFDEGNGSCVAEEADEGRVFLSWLSDPGRIADAAIPSLDANCLFVRVGSVRCPNNIQLK